MPTLLNRGLSAVVAGAYLVVAYIHGTGLDVAIVGAALLLPLACIWFSEAMGGYSGTMRLHPINAATPAVLVCAGGWFLLLGVPLILYFVMRSSEPA
jgi:hypothetical protein